MFTLTTFCNGKPLVECENLSPEVLVEMLNNEFDDERRIPGFFFLVEAC